MMTAALEETDTVRRALRLALAECLTVLHDDAHGGDGWSEEGYRALLLAAPLLGIDVTETHPDTGRDDGRWHLFPLPADVAAALRAASASATREGGG